MGKKWHVIYTKPRWEKKVTKLLTEKRVETYCPLNRVIKKWSDRIKLVEIPLFASYVFVNIDEKEKLKVRETEGVINFIYTGGKPAVARTCEIEKIKRFLADFENVELLHAMLYKDQRVFVKKGFFMDEEGRVVDLQNNKVKVEIDSLGYTLVAFFDRSELALKDDRH